MDKYNNRSYNFENRNRNSKSRPCRNIIETGICKKYNCFYAHNNEELKTIECTFGDNCLKYNRELNDNNCRFKHPIESLNIYYERLGFSVPLFSKNTISFNTTTEDLYIKLDNYIKEGHKLFHITIVDYADG